MNAIYNITQVMQWVFLVFMIPETNDILSGLK